MGDEYGLHIEGVGEVTAHVVGYQADADGMLKEVLLTTAAGHEPRATGDGS